MLADSGPLACEIRAMVDLAAVELTGLIAGDSETRNYAYATMYGLADQVWAAVADSYELADDAGGQQ